MSMRSTPLAASVRISASWTSEQALAVFELLDELRDAVWAIHGRHIQELLQQEQGCAARDLQAGKPSSGEPSF